ncbi:MAG: peptide chain release factor 1 [Eubacteriales bacterium]|nr:peptide chain release factor 1 [Clostridiales bacterium]MDD7300505.1 peptide chain release factor 1 [Eubacteriales bacterium]MDY4433591.1 peptide chain release factor 1 [Candidatus Flemingibacterium sp.]
MFEKLSETEKNYEKIAEDLSTPEVAADPERFAKLMREHKRLTPIVDKYREYVRLKSQIADAEEILAGGDAELAELAEVELTEAKNALPDVEHELQILLLPHDPNDDKNVIFEIRGGAGGEEAALFAYVLYRMYTMYAAKVGYKTEIINLNETELGGFKEVTFMIEGEGAYSRLKYESGVHRVQRVPETEAQGRIHTSTATVAVLPEAEDVEVEINPADLIIETCKSSGAGGQHVNKTESAIRLIHKPTGIVVECQDERSQYKNRDKAMKLLKTKLYDMAQAEQDEKIASERRSQVGTGDRSERIRTYNYPQSRVTDHRIGLTLYSLENFLNGDIDEMLTALATADTAAKLAKSIEQ